MASTVYSDDVGWLLNGDAKDCLEEIPDNHVDFAITSPPYWAQRDYGTSEQLGQEANYKDYLEKLANIFLETQRVLKPTGTLWVVINDTSFSERKGSGGRGSIQDGSLGSRFVERNYEKNFTPKSLVNIPHRLAIKMTDDHNWIHRMTICWHKRNAMLQPHHDKFTRNFEYILVFAKSSQYYHQKLVEESSTGKDDLRLKWQPDPGMSTYIKSDQVKTVDGRNMRSVWDLEYSPEENDIWTVNPKKVKGLKHFATYPEELVRRAITFGCPENGIVLDPFLGSGTTAKVALDMGRKWIGCEINPEYCNIALNRILKVYAPKEEWVYVGA